MVDHRLVCVRPFPIDEGRNQSAAPPGGAQRCGSNSATLRAGCVGSRCRTSFRYAYGPSSLSRADCTRLMTAAARWPTRNEPANNQFARPSAIDLIWFSTNCYRWQVPIVEVAGQRRPALEAVVQCAGQRGAFGGTHALREHPGVQRFGHRPCLLLTDGGALLRVQAAHRTLYRIGLAEEQQGLARAWGDRCALGAAAPPRAAPGRRPSVTDFSPLRPTGCARAFS